MKRAGPGENLRVRLSGIEEEDILGGFVLSSIGEWFSFLPFTPLCCCFVVVLSFVFIYHQHSQLVLVRASYVSPEASYCYRKKIILWIRMILLC